MSVIPHKAFTGEFPRVLPHDLPAGAAQFTSDCDFTRNNLTGIKAREAVPGVVAPGAKSLFVYDSISYSFYSWTRDVDAVRSPIASDAYSRFYWGDGTNFWVSRGDVGGNGNEPSGTNRYWVGVPQPSAAMTLDGAGTAFSLNGYSVSGITAFCENTDGTRANATALTYTASENSLTKFAASASVSISCSASGSSSSGASGLLPVGVVTLRQTWIYGDFGESTVTPHTERAYRKSSDTGLNTTELYVHVDMPSGVAYPTSIQIMEGVYIQSLGHFVYDLSYIGNNWYCTNASAKPPGGSSVSLPSSLAVEVKFADGKGSIVKAVLREDSNKTTIPDVLSTLSASFAYNGSTLTVTLTNRTDYVEARAYVYTYINQYGEEGPPSKPLVIDIVEGQTPKLRYAVPSASDKYVPISRVRVYRTATGTANTDYLYVGEMVINTTNPTFTDTVSTAALGESIQTRDFYPPDQTLKGVCAMPNGILAAFRGNEIHFSEPYLPYAWKQSAIQTLEHRVVGICPFENGLYVTTTSHPVLITGVSPETMTAQKIPAIQAGVSKGSICNAGPYAVYASHDGLVVLRGLDATLDWSFKFFTREQWRSLYGNKLNQMRLNAHDGHLLMWFTDGSPGFLMRFDETNPTFTRVTDPVYCAVVHPISDALYVGNGSTIYNFKGGSTRLPFTHWGKDYVLNKPESLGCIQLVGGGSLIVTVYADGTQVHQEYVVIDLSGSTLLRLPSGFLARRWSFKVEGAADAYLYEFNIAGVPQELKNV